MKNVASWKKKGCCSLEVRLEVEPGGAAPTRGGWSHPFSQGVHIDFKF